MKRFSNILAVVFVLAALVGCENSVDTPAPNPGLDPNAKYILFDVGIEESRGVALNSADHVDFTQFSIYGYTYITGTRWNAWKTIAKPNVFDDVPEKVVKAGSYFSYVEDGGNLKTWDEGDGRYSFFAVYPEASVGTSLGSIAYPVNSTTEGVPYVTYTRPDDATKMVDLMTGAHIDPTYSENGSYVSFDMEHRLAAVDIVALNHYEFDHDSDPITTEKHVTIRITSLNVKFDNLLYTSADIYLDKVGIKGTPTVRRPEYKPENSAVAAVTYTILADSDADYDVEPNNVDKDHRNISADREKTMFFIPQEMDSTTDATLEKTDIKATVTGTFEKWYDANGDGTLDTQIMEEYDEDGNLIDADGKFSINNQIRFSRHLEESYRYNVRLTFTSAAVSITVLTAEKWVDVPIYHEFH